MKLLDRLKKFKDRVFKLYPNRVFRSGYRGTGYKKMRWANGELPIPWGIIFLKMEAGDELPMHRDQGVGKFAVNRSYRINLLIRNAKKGGQFQCEGKYVNLFNRLYIFRADTQLHGVTKVEEGSRLMMVFEYSLKPRKGEVIPRAKMGKFVDPE